MKAEGNVNLAEKSELRAHLHRLYLKDTHMKLRESDHKPVPAMAPDFQDILSNLTLVRAGKSAEGHQLEVQLNMDKKSDEIAVRVVHNDFRVLVAPPVVAGALELVSLILSQVRKIQQTAVDAGFVSRNFSEEDIKPRPHKWRASTLPVSKRALKFSGEVSNIEVWLPRNVTGARSTLE